MPHTPKPETIEVQTAKAVDPAAICSPFEAGHVTMPVMIDGRRATITADPDMPEATRNALMEMVRCAFAAIERGDFDGKANIDSANSSSHIP